MNYKYTRKEISNLIKGTPASPQYIVNCLLATKPESDKEKCLHDHLCCPGDIKTVRCAYCGKSMYHEPQEELEVEPVKISERDTISCVNAKLINKQNELIKAHNALVKEVRG